MKWPLVSRSIFNTLVNNNQLTVYETMLFESFNCMDISYLQKSSISELSKLSGVNRQTLLSKLDNFEKLELIINTSIGRIITIPTWNSCIGKCIYSKSNILVISCFIPLSNVTCIINVYNKKHMQNILPNNFYYFELERVVKVDEHEVQDTHHMEIIAEQITSYHFIENITEFKPKMANI